MQWRYDSSGVARLASDRVAVVPDVIDARPYEVAVAGLSESDAEREIQEVRESVRAHARAAGMVEDGAPVVPAPQDPGAVATVLSAAAQQGASEVVFVRYYYGTSTGSFFTFLAIGWVVGIVPALLLDLIPISHQGAVAVVEVVVVDPRSGDVLHEEARIAAHDEQVNQYSFSPDGLMRRLLRRSVQALFETTVQARASGYPRRRRVADVGQFVVGRPIVRLEGARAVGPGFAIDVPDGWRRAESVLPAVGLFESPDGAGLSIVLEPTQYGMPDYGRAGVEGLRNIGGRIVSETARPIADRAAILIESELPDGTRAMQRITSAGGMGFIFTCRAPGPVFERHRGECARVLDTAMVQAIGLEGPTGPMLPPFAP